MTIKLTPEHVGGRVLLSDGTVHFVTNMTDTHYWLTEAGVPDESLILKLDGLDDDDDDGQLIQCLLDAPNQLDVPVPEWCEQVLLWFDGVGDFVCWGDIVTMESRAAKMSETANSACEGWSPAPGQMPPREDAA